MRLLYLALLGLLVLSRLAAAKEEWHEASSANFVLMTNASPERGESLVLTLERFRAALGQVLPDLRRWTSGRTRLYGFRDRESLEPFLPPHSDAEDSRVTGYFRAGTAENVIVLDLEGGIPAFERVLFHEYVHLVLNLSGRRLPFWIEEGLSEFYAGSRLSDDEAEVGVPDPRHLSLLARSPLLSFEELVSTEEAGGSGPFFYAQSWALVHYLLVEAPGGRERLARYLELFEGGADSLAAFQEAFGSEPLAMEEAFQAHVQRMRFAGSKTPLTASAKGSAQSRPLSEAEVQERWGQLYLATSRQSEARVCLEKAVRLAPELGSAWEALGLLEREDGRLDLAARHLEKAIDLGSASASGLYRYADVLLERYRGRMDSIPAPIASKAASALRASLQRAPSAREPAELLIFLYIVRGERLGEAKALLEMELAIHPLDPSLLFLEGQLLAKHGEYQKARETVERVMEETADPRLRDEAEKFLERITEVERAPGK